MITVVTWLWKGTSWRNTYTAEHVNILQRMVAVNLHLPHRFICVTDMPEGINCETLPLVDLGVKPIMPDWPNCYNRLRAFGEEMGVQLSHNGDRFISIDLDTVIVDDITPLISRSEDFVILEGKSCHYNGSLWMMKPGARKKVWEEFDPAVSPIMSMQGQNKGGGRFYGSDQAWISYCLGDGEATWKLGENGLYQFTEINSLKAPIDARLIFFAGDLKPWTENPLDDLRGIYNKYRLV